VYENRLVRRISGFKREEVAAELRRLGYEGFSNVHCSQSFIRVIKLRMLRWARHFARMGEISNA
jgi:hypothetical protein